MLSSHPSVGYSWSGSELVFKSATELVRLIGDRDLSSVELVQAYLQQIEAVNPQLNAVITLDAEGALARAKAADEALADGDTPSESLRERLGVLHGLPMTIKDAFATAGIRTTFGNPQMVSYIPDRDADAVATLKQAGAILLGKTNIPTHSYDWQCQHPTAGRANNPWNQECTPGGSSGGAAAAVAAGLTPWELGSDLAGSIRLPAHFCGICGFRPTEGMISYQGHSVMPGESLTMRGFLTVGPMARTVADLELLFSVLHPGGLIREHRELRSLKLAWTEQLGDIPLDEDIRCALSDFRGKLEQAGCQVETVDWVREEWLERFGMIHGAQLSSFCPPWLRQTVLPRWYWERVWGRSRWTEAIAQGMKLSLEQYLRLWDERDRFLHQMDRVLAAWDGWLCPVAPLPAIPHCPTGTPLQIQGHSYPYADVFGMYLGTTAMLATPVVTFPIGWSRTRLPVGIQLIGRRWQDNRILAIARALSETVASGNAATPVVAESENSR